MSKLNLKLSWASQGVLQLHKGRGKKKELIGELKGLTHKYLCENMVDGCHRIGDYRFNYDGVKMIISLEDYDLWNVSLGAMNSDNMALE